MMIDEMLRKVLEEKYGRVLVEKNAEGAAAYLPEIDTIICIRRGRHAYYAKIARLSETGGCETAYYHPGGLYVFSETLDKLIDRLIPKIQRIIGGPKHLH